MEEKINKLLYMIGPVLAIFGDSWAIGLRFYWFSIFFYKRWHPDLFYGDGKPCPWTGFLLCYKPNHQAGEGDCLWLKFKKWMWLDPPKERRNAA